jgi:hypothetical protein
MAKKPEQNIESWSTLLTAKVYDLTATEDEVRLLRSVPLPPGT